MKIYTADAGTVPLLMIFWFIYVVKYIPLSTPNSN
jgi:hypothetical protein